LVVLGVFVVSRVEPVRYHDQPEAPDARRGAWRAHSGTAIGAWCSPPTSTRDPRVWYQFARTGIGLAVRPLEDPNDRTRNLATLALLDSSFVHADDAYPPRIIVRDDAVHPDETTRPGWRDRVHQVALAYAHKRCLAGIFLVDEPDPKDFDRIADVAAAIEGEGLLAYVNLRPVSAYADVSEQERWRADATRLIRRGHLQVFSFAAYSQRPDGEDATFLLTLANAKRVATETGCIFLAVLQFTGFGPLDPLPRQQLDYLTSEAIAHGAGGFIWFTYWTPNPHEEGMWWRGGAIEYDGRVSARADTMHAANQRAHELASAFPGIEPRSVAHFGGAWPRGTLPSNETIRGLRSVRGGPVTVAAALPHRLDDILWMVINRDRSSTRTFELDLDSGIGARNLERGPGESQELNIDARTVGIRLDPGGAAVLHLGVR
jgi:hypothetical protein